MSSRHDNDYPYEAGLPESAPDADALHDLQLASQAVLQLATQAHAAVARNDEAAAQAARASLERQLSATTRMIDAFVFGDPVKPTTH